MDDLVPEEFGGLIEKITIIGVANDLILLEIVVGQGLWIDAALKLVVKPPEDALVKFLMAEADKITLNIEGDDKSWLSVIAGGEAEVMSEALLAIEDAFADATRVRIGNEAAVPPTSVEIVEKMVNDAVAEGSGDNLARDGVVDDKSYATVGPIDAADDAVAQELNVLHVVELEAVLVDGLTLTLAGDFVGTPELLEQKVFKTRGHNLAIS